MIKLKNYFQHTSSTVKKWGLLLRGFIATITGSAFVQGDVKIGFYVLVAGGLIDFILQCLPPDKQDPAASKPAAPTGPVTVILLLMAASIFFTSCSVIKPEVDRTKTDTTITSYKQVDIKLTGAKVFAGLNMDSLYHFALVAKDQYKDDSIARLNVELKYKQDSIAALKADNPIPPKPVYIASPPQKQYVTDPQTKAQLSYWIDAYGKFQIECESKDQTIQTLQAQVTKLTKDTTVTTKVAYQTPTWNKVVMIVEAILCLLAILYIVFKSLI